MGTKVKKLNQSERETLYQRVESYILNHPLRQPVYVTSGSSISVELGDYVVNYSIKNEFPDFSNVRRVKLITSRELVIYSIQPPQRPKFMGLYHNDRLVTMRCHSNRACREVIDILDRLQVLDSLASV